MKTLEFTQREIQYFKDELETDHTVRTAMSYRRKRDTINLSNHTRIIKTRRWLPRYIYRKLASKDTGLFLVGLSSFVQAETVEEAAEWAEAELSENSTNWRRTEVNQ